MNIEKEMRFCIINNDLNGVKMLVENNNVSPLTIQNKLLWLVCRFGSIELLEYFLLNEKVDPSSNENTCIYLANKYGLDDILKALYKDKRVKESLLYNHPSLHSKLVTECLRDKITRF